VDARCWAPALTCAGCVRSNVLIVYHQAGYDGKLGVWGGYDPSQVPMAHLTEYGRWLAVADILLTVMLLMVIVRRGLARKYRLFLSYMALQSVTRIVFLFLGLNKNRFAYFYLSTTPVLWIVGILVVHELYEDILTDYPGILSLGKWVITGSFALAVCISLLTADYDWNVSAHKLYPILFYYSFIERGITTAQVLFLLLMTVFLRWFPAPLKRNVHVHTVILFLYFLIKSSSLLFRNLTGAQVTMMVNMVTLMASCLCVLGWIWQLSPELADRAVTYRKVDQEEETRILAGLRAVNKTLLGLAKQ
jgi:hypothetical protein